MSSHLELFTLLWLDDNESIEEDQETQQELRAIINYLKKFTGVQECRKYIERRSKDERLVLVVSGRLGREIVPYIHLLRQVSSIYVYCWDKEANEQWACNFPKVKAVIVELDELVSHVQSDFEKQKNIDEPWPINMFTTTTSSSDEGTSTTGVNGHFIFSQVLLDCLLRMPFDQSDRNELISCCKMEYEGNTRESDHIDEFEKNYSSDKALWWYTRTSFCYKTLNAALRTQNIHLIFLFRSFIDDIQRQLQEHQSKHPMRVYRGQLMSSDELNVLQQWIGQFISINCFFSASIESSTAHAFLDASESRDLERVFFQIDADPTLIKAKPFADIRDQSAFPEEGEVLFMVGSIFRIVSIDLDDDDQTWRVRMTVCGDDEHHFNQVLRHLTNLNGQGQTNLRIFAKILSKMGKCHLAEKYLSRFVDKLLPNDPLLGTLFEELAEATAQQGNYDRSIHWHEKSLQFHRQHPANTPLKPLTASTSIRQLHPDLRSFVIGTNRWARHGITIAGGHGKGDAVNQLNSPLGHFVDEEDNVVVVDCRNDRIVEWQWGVTNGRVLAGGNGRGDRPDQLNCPTDVIFDRENGSLIISDSGNRRGNTRIGETIIDDIDCSGLAMDDEGSLYVTDVDNHQVKRYRRGETTGLVVAGGNEQGDDLDQLNAPRYIALGRDRTLYVSDNGNHRVMKWMKDATAGILVAGEGEELRQLSDPQGVIIDETGTLFVADTGNHRVMQCSHGSTKGTIVVGGTGKGNASYQLHSPIGLSFDRRGHLYVTDARNRRVQRFAIRKS